MATPQRKLTSAEEKWDQMVNTEHLSTTVIRVFAKLGNGAPGADRTRQHVESCDECARVFTALANADSDRVLLDYVYESREALRQLWQVDDDRHTALCEELSTMRRRQNWILIGIVALLLLRLFR